MSEEPKKENKIFAWVRDQSLGGVKPQILHDAKMYQWIENVPNHLKSTSVALSFEMTKEDEGLSLSQLAVTYPFRKAA